MAAKGAFSLAVSGGAVAQALRGLPSAAKAAGLDFAGWHVWFCHDSLAARQVQAEAEDSWLGACGLPAAQVHQVPALPPEGAAAEYTAGICMQPETIISDSPGGLPAVDMMILDLGEDGRCAGIRPGSPEMKEVGSEKVVLPIEEPGTPHSLALSIDFMNASRRAVVFAAAPSVTGAVAAALDAGPAVASGKSPAGKVMARVTAWFCTRASIAEYNAGRT